MIIKIQWSVIAIGWLVGFSCITQPMEHDASSAWYLELETSDNQTILLSPLFTPCSSMQLIEKNKAKLNGTLSSRSWRLAFDIFSIVMSVESNNTASFDIITDTKNLFIKHNLSKDDAKSVIGLLGLFLENNAPVVNELLHSFIRFTKGDFRSDQQYNTDFLSDGFDHAESQIAFLNTLDNQTKTVLDKYYYLNFNKHFALPQNCLGHVSIDELIRFTDIKKNISNHAKELYLNDLYIASLDGWQNLSQKQFIRPDQIRIIDLSCNGLKTIPADMLQGFTNLEKLILAHNAIASLPEGLLSDCTRIAYIDVSHNMLKELPLHFTKRCKQAPTINLEHNLGDTKTNERVFQSADDWVVGSMIFACLVGYLVVILK